MLYLQALKVKYKNVSMFWMTTNPAGYDHSMQVPGNEWRTDSVLDRYNKIAVKIAQKHNMAILDSYQIANPLRDLSYDSFHYKGIVGWTVTDYTLRNICSR